MLAGTASSRLWGSGNCLGRSAKTADRPKRSCGTQCLAAVLLPVLLQTTGLLLGEPANGAVLLFLKIGVAHGASGIAKVSEIGEMAEVCGGVEAEVVLLLTIDVGHEHPLLLPDELVHMGCFAADALLIAEPIVVGPGAGDAAARGLFDAGRAVVSHIEQMILPVAPADKSGKTKSDVLVKRNVHFLSKTKCNN